MVSKHSMEQLRTLYSFCWSVIGFHRVRVRPSATAYTSATTCTSTATHKQPVIGHDSGNDQVATQNTTTNSASRPHLRQTPHNTTTNSIPHSYTHPPQRSNHGTSKEESQSPHEGASSSSSHSSRVLLLQATSRAQERVSLQNIQPNEIGGSMLARSFSHQDLRASTSPARAHHRQVA